MTSNAHTTRADSAPGIGWTFLTNHAHILLAISAEPDLRIRDVAERVGITERAAQRIVADLVESGYIEARREGRRNHYSIHPEQPLRHPAEQHHQIGELLTVLAHRRHGE
jgi:DNA-binding IclR family transcriptional regulator